MAINLTESAAAEIKRYMDEQKVEAGTMLRMGVAGGGCSGLQYTLGFESTADCVADARYEQHGVTIITSKKMALHLDDTTVDLSRRPDGTGNCIIQRHRSSRRRSNKFLKSNYYKLQFFINIMDVDSAIKSRKSVRSFKDKKPDWRDIIDCIDKVRFSPSAGKNFTLKIILINDKGKIQKIANAAEQPFIAEAQYVVVIYSDPSRLILYLKIKEKHIQDSRQAWPAAGQGGAAAADGIPAGADPSACPREWRLGRAPHPGGTQEAGREGQPEFGPARAGR